MSCHIDYTCPDCGGQAAVAPGLKGQYPARVTVLHAKGCPRARRLALLRAGAR